MNKKRIILLLFLTVLIFPMLAEGKEKKVKFETEWHIPTRVPFELPFEASISEDRMLCLHFISDGTFALHVKDLNGQGVYTTTVSALSGQDVFIDLKQLPAGTYLLSLKNEYVEATGYLIL